MHVGKVFGGGGGWYGEVLWIGKCSSALISMAPSQDAPEPSETSPQATTPPMPQATTPPMPPVAAPSNSTYPQAPHVAPYLDRDVSRFLPSTTPTWQQPKWTGPPTPATPMDQLIGMGFANRELNNSLLAKHNNNIQAVLNELLDERNSEAVRV